MLIVCNLGSPNSSFPVASIVQSFNLLYWICDPGLLISVYAVSGGVARKGTGGTSPPVILIIYFSKLKSKVGGGGIV